MRAIILCYHKVGPQNEEGRRLNVSAERLRSHVSFFLRRGYRSVCARDLADAWNPRTVCFSFDDAYWSAMEWGLPVLDSAGVRATFYAVPSLVGRSSVWDAASPRPLADWDRLLDAQAKGHEIGNHSFDHAHLARLSLSEQLDQVLRADAALRERGIVPGSFCFPYGSHNADTLSALRSCAYRVGLALGKRAALPSDDRLALPRFVIGFSDTLPMLLYKVFLRPKMRRAGG